MRSLIVLLAASLLNAAGHAAPRDPQLYAAAAAVQPQQLGLLAALVNIDSGTGDAAGASRVDGVLIPRLKALGASVETIRAEAAGLGDNLVARVSGTGRGRILMIAHIDTVFGSGTAAERPFRRDAERAYGPGVGDEKGGVAEAVTALQLLHDLHRTGFARITLLIETSEETGSPGTRALIDRLVRDADVELNIEPGDAPDMITVWRKGSATIRLTVHGRAAHAGMAPQDGRNAAIELIHQLETIKRFPQAGDGITVNLTTIRAGERNNVIPDLAEAQINYRVRSADQFEEVANAFREAARHTMVPDTTVEVSVTPSFPPLASNAATDALAEKARGIYAELGRTLQTGGNGGASESALAAAAGTPALDGLGPVGGGFHSVREYIELGSVTPRLYLLARLLEELGANPPAR
jgi:glutamate carboxypeptidase